VFLSLINFTNPHNLNSALLRTLYSKIATIVGDAHFCIFCSSKSFATSNISSNLKIFDAICITLVLDHVSSDVLANKNLERIKIWLVQRHVVGCLNELHG
jgi:hypothetical protein